MLKKQRITVVGAGRLGSALAVALAEAGFALDEIVTRDRPESIRRARQVTKRSGGNAIGIGDARLGANVIWLCVGDGEIRQCTDGLADRATVWKGKTVFHSSGALASDELRALRSSGASVASVHPMMSFVHATKPSLAGVTFAVEGDSRAVRVARGIVRDLKGRVIAIGNRDKALYHAWGTFASPLIVAELAMADRVASKIGIAPAKARKTLAPILRQTVENYLAHGPALAFSGPIVRGDIETVRRHLDVLRKVPGAREVYLTLATAAAMELPAGNRKELLALLQSAAVGDHATGAKRK